jgi:hypothetical protein
VKKVDMDVGDYVALELQSMFQRRQLDSEQSLVSIRSREVDKARFQFDMISGKLHRAGCSAVPASSTSALYAVWNRGDCRAELECGKCRPEAAEAEQMSKNSSGDILFGLLSVVDQFSSVLKERGQEYRSSPKGQQLGRDLDQLLSTLDETQKEVLQLAITSLDALLGMLVKANEKVSPGQEAKNGSGAVKKGAGNGTKQAAKNDNQRKRNGGL